MGMERTIAYAGGSVPEWTELEAKLAEAGLTMNVRMIDGLPALIDEKPTAGWSEVRVSLPAGMITLRRDGANLRCVVWGNADDVLREQWETLSQACAELGGTAREE